MIDEKKLIDFIDAGKFRNADEICFSENDVVRLIKNFTELSNELGLNEQPKTDWIPYTTNGELPYNGQKVWLSFSNEICSYVKQAWWIYDHFEWNNGKRVRDYPLAWMPYIVPQPYKKEGAE